MLSGVIFRQQHTYSRQPVREKDLKHLVDLILNHVCKGRTNTVLHVLGLMQRVHVSSCADDWLEEHVYEEPVHDLHGESGKHP